MDQSEWLKERVEISRKIRATLVGLYVDLGVMQIVVSPFKIILKGQLKSLPGSHMQLSGPVIEEMLRSIRRIPHVRNVSAEFDNWFQDAHDGAWTQGQTQSNQQRFHKGKAGEEEGVSYTIKRKNRSAPNQDDPTD